jgi:transposase-like protein/IS1 family transposase
MVSRLDRIEENVQNRPLSVLEITRSHDLTINWLLEHNLIKRNPPCPSCESRMAIQNDKKQADRQIFKCGRCGKRKSLRYFSVFEGYKLTLIELTSIMFHYFLTKKTIKSTVLELGISHKSVAKVYSYVRGLISNLVQMGYESDPLGIEPQDAELPDDRVPVVEADESLFSHFGDVQVWVFGIYDRGTDRVRAWVVRDRTAATLLPIIQDHVEEGAVIYTDGWLSYGGLEDLGYEHRIVIHEEGFGSGLNTTNHIESCWSELKELSLYSRGIQGGGEDRWEDIQEYIDLAIWLRENKGRNLVEELIEVLNFYAP